MCLPGHCYAVAKVFWLVSVAMCSGRLLWCFEYCQGFTMQLLSYFKGLFVCCLAGAMMF